MTRKYEHASGRRFSGVFKTRSSGFKKPTDNSVSTTIVPARILVPAIAFFMLFLSPEPKKRAVTIAKPFVMPIKKPMTNELSELVAPTAASAFSPRGDNACICQAVHLLEQLSDEQRNRKLQNQPRRISFCRIFHVFLSSCKIGSLKNPVPIYPITFTYCLQSAFRTKNIRIL